MHSSSKFSEDWDEGESRREATARDLNFYLEKNDTGLRFERMQQFLKDMTVAEKVKNHKLKNIIQPAPHGEAMGLHYYLIKSPSNKRPFIFCYTDAGGFYLKVPKEYKGDPEAYLKLLEELNYYTIIVQESTKKYSHLISFAVIRKHWKRHMATSKGNTNRLQFTGEMSKIQFMHPERGQLIGTSLITSLKNLFI